MKLRHTNKVVVGIPYFNFFGAKLGVSVAKFPTTDKLKKIFRGDHVQGITNVINKPVDEMCQLWKVHGSVEWAMSAAMAHYLPLSANPTRQ